MSTVKAYYDGTTLLPIETLNFPKGKVVNLTIAAKKREASRADIERKLSLLKCIENDLERLNETEPLPPEFDEIMARRVNFSRELDL